jgi:PBP1b-binding outer membrane lipoprotein LpoB
MKKIHITTIILIISIILIGGCNVNENNDTYNEETVEKAKKTTEDYLRNNYVDVRSIELDEPYQSQMGSLSIEGTVNDKGFTIHLNEDFTVSSIGKKEGFPNKREECKERDCAY